MLGQTNKSIKRAALQRKLRKSMTDAERKLWGALRGRHMAQHRFRRQHPFGDYILDFVSLDARLIVEVDGSQHLESQGDVLRSELLQRAGFRVLRFWNNEVLTQFEAVKQQIWDELQRTPSPPRPSP